MSANGQKEKGTAQILVRALPEDFVKQFMQGHGAKYEHLDGGKLLLVAVKGPEACVRLQQLANEDAQARRRPRT